MNQELIRTTVKSFKEKFGVEPLVVRAPGRVNLIGEHTDYNEGFVLPAAIDKAICVAISPRKDSGITLYSEEFSQRHETSYDNLSRSSLGWPNYVLGVVDQLVKRGYKTGGFNMVLNGDVPIGSGLSSSAAVECATAVALNHLFNLQLSSIDLTLIAQKAEHEFAGVLCGIMDQFASMHGKKDHVIRLDCRSLEYEHVPLHLGDYIILLLNTNVKHSLASSEYNTRRAQCEKGVQLISAKYPEVKSLRDATMEMVDEMIKEDDIYRKCKYVVSENMRLLQGCEDLKKGDLVAFGKKMFQTHEGLSLDYEVSCPELDFLVEKVKGRPEVAGARMMGGGFGGCTINLVKKDAVEPLISELSSRYREVMGKELTPYLAQIEDGAGVISAS
jgi:galactokinase